MVALTEQVVVSAPANEVWALLSDPALVASCIPGAALGGVGENGAYSGSLTVKFGPTQATFRGEVTLGFDHAARSISIEGRGVDQRGASRALGSGQVSVSGDEQALVTVNGSYSVTGPLQMFASAGGVHVARALLATFAENIARLATERRAEENRDVVSQDESIPIPEPSPTGSRRELDGLQLLRRIAKDWLAGLIKRVFSWAK